jgi:hypothetical protein
LDGADGLVQLRIAWAASERLWWFGLTVVVTVPVDWKAAVVDGGYFGGYVKPANQKEYRRIGAFHGTKTASARLLS